MLDDEPVWCRIVASLTLFDGVLQLEDIHRACAALAGAYRLDGHCVVDWLDADGRQNRRYLSRMTASLEPWQLSSPSADELGQAIDRWASLVCHGRQDPKDQLYSELESYWFEVLPGMLLAHIKKDAPITELPRSCHARRVSKMRLKAESERWMSGQVAYALGVVVDHAFHSPKMRSGQGLVDRVIEICAQYSRRNDASDKQQMLDACLRETERVGQTDVLSALLLAWVIDLIESGGLKERNPKPQTIYKYVRNTLPGLHEHLAGRDVFNLQTEDFDDAYAEILAATGPGNRTHCITGLKTWHSFLVEWCEVPELAKPLDLNEGPVIPKANILHEHELNLLYEWIDASGLDDRLQAQLVLCIHLAANIRLRAKELFTLRRRNIRRFDGVVEVEVAPRIVDGPPKTESGRRVQSLNDPEAVRQLLAWDDRRESEGALLSDYLFGDPHQPEKVYQFGKMYMLINQRLKWVSGDSGISLHTLSHTWVSNSIRNALLNRTDSDVPCLEVIATSAGHRSAVTSITQYFHFPGEMLRHYIDRELPHLPLTSKTAQRWSGVRADALRKRASTRKQSLQAVYWESIFQNDSIMPVVGPEYGLQMAPLRPPEFDKPSIQIDLNKVVGVMQDAAIRWNSEQIALRAGLDRTDVERIMKVTGEIVCGLRTKRVSPQPSKRMVMQSKAFMFDGLPSMGIKLSKLKRGFWKSIKQRAQIVDGDKFAKLVDAWQMMFDRGYLDLSMRQYCMVIVEFLKTIGISSAHLAFVVACNEPHRPTSSELALESGAILVFERWYGVRPMIVRKMKRRNRPDIYLVWSAVPLVPGTSPSSASTSLSGFHALMLCASVYVELGATKIIQVEGSNA
jgi:integrase